jgi:hypothetical protein
MSKYKVIKTEFKNGESLKKALDEMGVKYEFGGNFRDNTVTLRTSWASYGSQNHPVVFAIQRDEARLSGLGQMDGLGFKWTGTGYDLIEDSNHGQPQSVIDKMNILRQKYAVNEIRRQARVKGYSVREQAQTDGTIQMTLVRR